MAWRNLLTNHYSVPMPFVNANPSREDYWRSVILFGRNVASYKFALAKSLLELADRERNFISLEELAVPFARHIAEHLKQTDKQATSASSRFLASVRQFNNGEVTHDALVKRTASLGFQNVIDAFHVVNRATNPSSLFRGRAEATRRDRHNRRTSETERVGPICQPFPKLKVDGDSWKRLGIWV